MQYFTAQQNLSTIITSLITGRWWCHRGEWPLGVLEKETAGNTFTQTERFEMSIYIHLIFNLKKVSFFLLKTPRFREYVELNCLGNDSCTYWPSHKEIVTVFLLLILFSYIKTLNVWIEFLVQCALPANYVHYYVLEVIRELLFKVESLWWGSHCDHTVAL